MRISPPAFNYAGITSPFNDNPLSLAVKTVVLGSPEDWLLSWLCVCLCIIVYICVYMKHTTHIIALSNLNCKRAAQGPGVYAASSRRGVFVSCVRPAEESGLWAHTHSRDPGPQPSQVRVVHREAERHKRPSGTIRYTFDFSKHTSVLVSLSLTYFVDSQHALCQADHGAPMKVDALPMNYLPQCQSFHMCVRG